MMNATVGKSECHVNESSKGNDKSSEREELLMRNIAEQEVHRSGDDGAPKKRHVCGSTALDEESERQTPQECEDRDK